MHPSIVPLPVSRIRPATNRIAEATVCAAGCIHRHVRPAAAAGAACHRSAPKNSEKPPARVAKSSKTAPLSRCRGSSAMSPREVWSGRSSFAPGVCVTRSSISFASHAASSRRISSCMSSAFDRIFPAAPRADMLSVSMSNVRPRS